MRPDPDGERQARTLRLGAATVIQALEELTAEGEPRRRWDCIVVGAGPAGSTAAFFLARAGLSFSVLKARFDPWLAAQAVKAGARLLVNTLAERLIVEGGRVAGVQTAGPWPREFRAPVTILAEGATAWLASRAGLVPRWKPEEVSLDVKEVIALPPAVIRERSARREGEAAVLGFFGVATAYLPGTACLHTCRDCVGLNAGALLARQRDTRRAAVAFLHLLKAHPLLRPLLDGGRTVEYSAHLIPDGGFPALREMVHDGCLLVGDAAGLVNGTHGITNAVYSGQLAADAVLAAAARGDFSRRALSLYRDLLEASPVLKDLRAHADVPSFYERLPHVTDVYPRLLAALATELATVYPLPKLARRRHLWRQVLAARPPLALARDLAATLKALR